MTDTDVSKQRVISDFVERDTSPIWKYLSRTADMIAILAPLTAAVGWFTSKVSPTILGILLIITALASVIAMISPGKSYRRNQLVGCALAAALASTGAVVLLNGRSSTERRTSPIRVEIVEPAPGTIESKCRINVRFTGEPPPGQSFAVATVQAGAMYYFEGIVRRDDSISHGWYATVQVGFRNRGRGEQYEIKVYTLNDAWKQYLSTTRRDISAGNTYWSSTTLPPGVDQPSGSTSVTRALTADPSCPS